MAVDVIMPKVDMDQETGTVLQWLKKEGDAVEQGEIILEIETDKVAIEVEAPSSGILSNILVQEGESVPIATTIATILQPGEDPKPARSLDNTSQAGQSSKTSQVSRGEDLKPARSLDTNSQAGQPSKISQVLRHGNGLPVTPVARKLAAASGVDIASVDGTGRGGKVTRKDVESAMTPAATGSDKSGKVAATPAARRRALEEGVELASLAGSGPDGRIQESDVQAAARPPRSLAAASGSESPSKTSEAYETVPLRGKRRTIAERMTASYQNAPHITFTARVDMSGFNEARAQLNARIAGDGVPVSATALMVKIVAQTLTRHPWLNSALLDEEIRLYHDVHIGVAVALEDGLIVPVVHDAAEKGVAQIAVEIKDLAARAREGKLRLAEVRDATFSLSNLGPFGVEHFTAIINPPQAAILAVGAMQPEVVPDSEGQVVVRPMMRITLSADHRVIDGAVAAHFIADLKAALESPLLLLF